MAFKKTIISIFFLLFVLSTFSQLNTAPESSLQKQARTLINLLDYVSQDYVKAVNDGKVINKDEYSEMLDFSAQTISLLDSIVLKTSVENKKDISAQLSSLLSSIKSKSSKDVIAKTAQQVKKQILALHLIDIFPEQFPDIIEGKRLFVTNCQSCHGRSGGGDGPLSGSFTPRPANLQDDSLMQYISPLQIFNTARLGVKGTGMRAFDELSDKQLWQIAFYIKSLRFENKFTANADSLVKLYNQVKPEISLSDIAHLSDRELEEKLSGNNNEKLIAAIRLHRPQKNESNSLTIAINYLDDAISFYKNNNPSGAEEKALYAYLDGIEPLEQQLTAIDANIVPELENKMNALRSAIRSGKSPAEVEQRITEAKTTISKARSCSVNRLILSGFLFLLLHLFYCGKGWKQSLL